jgi:hypothetical protein
MKQAGGHRNRGHGWNLCILFQKRGDYQSMISTASVLVFLFPNNDWVVDAVEIEGAQRRDALTQPLEGFWVARIDGWDYVKVLEEGLDIQVCEYRGKCDRCMW